MTSKLTERSAAIAALSDEERARGRWLMRRCDAYVLLQDVLEEAHIPNTADRETALTELRIFQEDAATALSRFNWEHGIPEL